MVLTTVLSMLRYVGEIDDRDFVDRLHSYFTTNILIAFAILVSFKVCIRQLLSLFDYVWKHKVGKGQEHLNQLRGCITLSDPSIGNI